MSEISLHVICTPCMCTHDYSTSSLLKTEKLILHKHLPYQWIVNLFIRSWASGSLALLSSVLRPTLLLCFLWRLSALFCPLGLLGPICEWIPCSYPWPSNYITLRGHRNFGIQRGDRGPKLGSSASAMLWQTLNWWSQALISAVWPEAWNWKWSHYSIQRWHKMVRESERVQTFP